LFGSITSILQPVLIDISQAADRNRREEAIISALDNESTEQKILSSGRTLAAQVDSYAVTQRWNLAGQFVETLISIRQKSIDISKAPGCKELQPLQNSGAPPTAGFISCWQAAWAQLEPQVTALVKIGDTYDGIADAGNVSAQSKFNAIMKAYDNVRAGKEDNTSVFWDNVTELVTLTQAIANAASSSNISTLQKDLKDLTK
jgi:hypothetical protein